MMARVGIALMSSSSALCHISNPNLVKAPIARMNSATTSIPFWVLRSSVIRRAGEACRRIHCSRLYVGHLVNTCSRVCKWCLQGQDGLSDGMRR